MKPALLRLVLAASLAALLWAADGQKKEGKKAEGKPASPASLRVEVVANEKEEAVAADEVKVHPGSAGREFPQTAWTKEDGTAVNSSCFSRRNRPCV